MPEATKATTTAKKTATRKRTPAPALDMSALTVEAAEAPTRTVKSTQNNLHVMKWMQESWAERKEYATDRETGRKMYRGSGRKVVVPVANKTQVENLIRYAANHMRDEHGNVLGSAIEIVELAGANRGKVEIRFCAKTRKAPRKNGKTP